MTSPISQELEEPLENHLIAGDVSFHPTSTRSEITSFLRAAFADIIPQSTSEWKAFLRGMFPLYPLLTEKYSRTQLLKDASSGIAVGVMCVRQCVAYKSIAMVPPTYLFYSALISTTTYAVFGQTAVGIGPAAETLLMVAQQTVGMSEENRIAFSHAVAVEVGLMSILMAAVFGGTILATAMPQSVSKGYTTAAACLVILGELKHILNVTAPSTATLHETLIELIRGLKNSANVNSVYSALMFGVYFGYLEAVRRFKKIPAWCPHALIVITVSTFLSWLCNFQTALDLSVLGALPGGMPPFSVPNFDGFENHFQFSLIVMIVAFLQSFSVATLTNPAVNPNQELFALGVKDVACGLLSGTTCAAGLGRSALYRTLGSSPVALLFTALVILLTLMVLAPNNVFYYLPAHATAAIICSAMLRMVDHEYPLKLWRTSKGEVLVWLVTCSLVWFVGIAPGIAFGIIMSLLLVVIRIARPRGTSVGFTDDTCSVTKSTGTHSELVLLPGVFCFRFEAPLYYVNLLQFRNMLIKAIAAEKRTIAAVIVDCHGIEDIDLSGCEGFFSVLEPLRQQEGMEVVYGGIHTRVLRKLRTVHTQDVLETCVFRNVADAVRKVRDRARESVPELEGPVENQQQPLESSQPKSGLLRTMKSFRNLDRDLGTVQERTRSRLVPSFSSPSFSPMTTIN